MFDNGNKEPAEGNEISIALDKKHWIHSNKVIKHLAHQYNEFQFIGLRKRYRFGTHGTIASFRIQE